MPETADNALPTKMIDLTKATRSEIVTLPGFAEISADKLLNLRNSGIPLTMSRMQEIPHFDYKLLVSYIDNKLVAEIPMYSKQEEATAASITPAASGFSNEWMDIITKEREEKEKLRAEFDRYRFQVEITAAVKDTERHYEQIIKEQNFRSG